jgi:hypothetical protein
MDPALDNQSVVEGNLRSSVRNAVIGDRFSSSEHVYSFVLGSWLGPDLVNSLEPVNYVVSTEGMALLIEKIKNGPVL